MAHNKKKLSLFHFDFVQSNKNLQIIINVISINICHEIDINLYVKEIDIFVIQLKGIRKIKSMFKMFSVCNDLISCPDIDNWDTSND